MAYCSLKTDREHEFVSVTCGNVAVVTSQENNAIVLIDTKTYSVITNFNDRTVDVRQVDTI